MYKRHAYVILETQQSTALQNIALFVLYAAQHVDGPRLVPLVPKKNDTSCSTPNLEVLWVLVIGKHAIEYILS